MEKREELYRGKAKSVYTTDDADRLILLFRNDTSAFDGKRIERFPFTMGAQARLKPIWEEFEGWSESTQGARSFAELPATCIKYVRRVEELVGCPVALLSTSPQREDTILMTDPFRD